MILKEKTVITKVIKERKKKEKEKIENKISSIFVFYFVVV